MNDENKKDEGQSCGNRNNDGAGEGNQQQGDLIPNSRRICLALRHLHGMYEIPLNTMKYT